MAFPNVDKILQSLFMKRYGNLLSELAFVINDNFWDLDEGQRMEIATYFRRKQPTTDLRDRDGSKIYIHTQFPMLDVAMPQISITLGQEDAERYMGDSTGQSEKVYADDGTTLIAYDIIKGFYARSSWNVACVAATKDETIWLSRICQRWIFDEMLTLERAGVAEVNVNMVDLKFDQELAPMTVFNRSLRITALTENTWKVRIPAAQQTAAVGTGTNTGLI